MKPIIHSILLAICGLHLYIARTTALPEPSHFHPSLISRSLPPIPDSNGICYTYTIQAGNTCASMARAYQVTIAEIETWNTGNYGWKGCSNIKQGDFICLSSGGPPMPVALPHATCGPQVPGTARPSDYSLLSSLNPCPSGHCCTSQGQCSPDSDLCTSDTCIAGCGAKSPPKPTAQAAQPPSPSKTTATLDTTYLKTTTKEATTTLHTLTSSFFSEETEQKQPTKPTTHPTATEQTNTAAWTMAAYLGPSCDGDYFVVQGHSSADNQCLNLSTLSPDYTETGVWCRWYGNGGFTMTSCDAIPDELIYSWRLIGGTCSAYTGNCDQSGDFVLDIQAGECQKEQFYHPHMLLKWNTLKCTVNT